MIDQYLTTSSHSKVTALIYGKPATGKTTGALSFPDPIVINIDNNLPPGTKNVIPLWSDEFVDKVMPRLNPSFPANRRDALVKILADLARECKAGQTIVLDSLTRLETWFNAQEEAEPKPRGKTGEPDGFQLFRKRLAYFDTVLTMMTACPANVVMIVHSQMERNDKGDLTGAIKPALIGQIGDKLPGYFPIVLQAERRENPTTKVVEFMWRIRPSVFEPARVPKPVTIDFIPQQYKELAKYL